MTHRAQSRFFASRRDRGAPLVLATVYQTEGSTYSKAGASMLIDGDGMFQGMLSGGCLEGDLAVRARVAINSGDVQQAVYDLGSSDDELWGMGVGCEGVMRVMLQPLSAEQGYQPWTALHEAACGRRETTAIVVVDGSEEAPAGATLLAAGEGLSGYGLPAQMQAALSARLVQDRGEPGQPYRHVQIAGKSIGILTYRVPLQPRLLVLGAGLDAGPVIRLAVELGWHCTLADHRPAYLDRDSFEVADRLICAPAAELARKADLDEFDLAIVMSHHLASDREYLSQLASAPVSYVGLLGPPARRDRLLADIGKLAKGLGGRLHGPAGIDLGGRGPAAIALSILAEMQAHLAGRSGGA